MNAIMLWLSYNHVVHVNEILCMLTATVLKCHSLSYDMLYAKMTLVVVVTILNSVPIDTNIFKMSISR